MNKFPFKFLPRWWLTRTRTPSRSGTAVQQALPVAPRAGRYRRRRDQPVDFPNLECLAQAKGRCVYRFFHAASGRGPKGAMFDVSRLPTSDEVSAIVVCGLDHVGHYTSLFSVVSARRGSLSTAIEREVPEHILWAQKVHADFVAAGCYVKLGSPLL